jgi:transposase InsO family protein
VTDITYIKTHEEWLYSAVVIDLFSRRVAGWSAQPRMTTELALQTLLAVVWRRKPKSGVMIHSDQGRSSPAASGSCSSASTLWTPAYADGVTVTTMRSRKASSSS